MINNRFLYYKNLNTFTTDLNNGQIDRESIVFIEQTKLIWTHGVYFGSDENKDTDIPIITVDDLLSTESTNPVENKVITAALNQKADSSTFNNYYDKEYIDTAFGINVETLQIIQDLIEQINEGDDNNNLQALFDSIAQKADKTDLDNYYTKTDSDSIYMTKAEWDDYKNPIRVTITINPSTIEYTDNRVSVQVEYHVYKGSQHTQPDRVVITSGDATVYSGYESNKKINTTVSTVDKTVDITVTKNGQTYTNSASVSFIKPTYMFYSAESSKDTVQLPQNSKHLWTSITQSNIALPNNQDGVYLWIVTPYNLNKVTTDAGRAYIVDMQSPITDSNTGLKYYRSILSIDRVNNINYWLS